MVFPQKGSGLIKRDALTELSLTHKIPIRHPPDSGDIHFPLIVFNYSLPLETASSHSSSLAAVTLKETPNQNICLSFSLRSDRWMRADTRGRCICPNQGLISVSPPGECFILTGHLWIRYLALIWRSGSPLLKCQVKSQRQWLRHGHYRQHRHSAFSINAHKCCSNDLSLLFCQVSCNYSSVLHWMEIMPTFFFLIFLFIFVSSVNYSLRFSDLFIYFILQMWRSKDACLYVQWKKKNIS